MRYLNCPNLLPGNGPAARRRLLIVHLDELLFAYEATFPFLCLVQGAIVDSCLLYHLLCETGVLAFVHVVPLLLDGAGPGFRSFLGLLHLGDVGVLRDTSRSILMEFA